MRRTVRLLACLALALALAACANSPFGEPLDPPDVYLVNIVPQRGGMLEQTLRVDLRIENPNNVDVHMDGISLEIDLNDRPFATARSTLDVDLPRLSSQLVSIEGRASTLDLIGQLDGVATLQGLSYALRGKIFLDELGIRGLRFERSAEIGIPDPYRSRGPRP